MEIYYNINNSFFENYEKKNINYELLKHINEIVNNNRKILKDINEIVSLMANIGY